MDPIREIVCEDGGSLWTNSEFCAFVGFGINVEYKVLQPEVYLFILLLR
jgi:hypothetical protein